MHKLDTAQPGWGKCWAAAGELRGVGSPGSRWGSARRPVPYRAVRATAAAAATVVCEMMLCCYLCACMDRWWVPIRCLGVVTVCRRAEFFVHVPAQGLQIHGNEPGPLFQPDDPYWSVYQNSTEFTPQPYQYSVVDSRALVMHNWTFNKTAWVIKSQVRSQASVACACTFNIRTDTGSPVKVTCCCASVACWLAYRMASWRFPPSLWMQNVCGPDAIPPNVDTLSSFLPVVVTVCTPHCRAHRGWCQRPGRPTGAGRRC